MSVAPLSEDLKKRTPRDTSAYEREQLRFFLSGGNVGEKLANINPSLAWLPVLQEMQVIDDYHQLVPWIERNLGSSDAVKEVVANIHFFRPETGKYLEDRIDQHADDLAAPFLDSWRLIVRYIKEAKPGVLNNEWYDIAPKVKRGEHSAVILNKIADALRPSLKIRPAHYLHIKPNDPPQNVRDLMKVELEVDDGFTGDEVLETWPKDTTADTDVRLLDVLSGTIEDTLRDAQDIGIEGADGINSSDLDIVSIARHDQNKYRTGFNAIVRVTADLWSRLAAKAPELALPFVERWFSGGFRLTRRMAVFAAENKIMPAESAGNLLLELPQRELLVNSTVEVYRLLLARWREFPDNIKSNLLDRILEGPPRDIFVEGTDVDMIVDSIRFEFLGSLRREGYELRPDAEAAFAVVREKYPLWELRPREQAGFHTWLSGGFRSIVGEANTFDNVSDDELVQAARNKAKDKKIFDGDDWAALAISAPDRAFAGLKRAVAKGDWDPLLWVSFLQSRTKYEELETEIEVASYLLRWPAETFNQMASQSAAWIDEHSKTLDDEEFWPLWDRIADVLVSEEEKKADA